MAKTVHVTCSHPTCSEQAAYKIAARWTDGRLAELKTYGFACSEHLGDIFRESLGRQQHYTPGPGETIEEMAIYRYEPGKSRDRFLQRLWGLKRTTVSDGHPGVYGRGRRGGNRALPRAADR